MPRLPTRQHAVGGGGLFGALLLLQEDFHLLLVGFLGSARPLSLGFRLGTAPILRAIYIYIYIILFNCYRVGAAANVWGSASFRLVT